MKTIIEIIKENKIINEGCGSQIYVGDGCGGGQWVNRRLLLGTTNNEKEK